MAAQLTSEITIGNFKFSGVNDVRTKRSILSFVDTASITIPSIAKIIRKNGTTSLNSVITAHQFEEGDPVTISLGYDGRNHVEFEGFLTRKGLNMPLVLDCEGYSYQLRRNKVSGYWSEISVSDLLTKAVEGTDITVQSNLDIKLTNVKALEAPGTEILNFILKATEGAVAVYFISPKVLWAGLVYSEVRGGTDVFSKGLVKYRLGYNCPKQNDLKKRTLSDNPVVVNFLKRTATGTIFNETSDEVAQLARKHKKELKHLAAAYLKKVAQEKQDRLNYIGYEGKLTGFLEPYCEPGYKVYLRDDRYPELNGNYLAEQVEVDFGVSGARRIVTLGPKLGWGDE